ncbi:MAG: DUF6794 domain-containing protein [Saprospiraceae bacterium]
MKYIYSFLSIFLSVVSINISEAQTAEEFEANYAKRIKEEMIYGVYIPVDLDDAYSELNRLSNPNALGGFKNAPEEEIRRKLHFGLGRWILSNWGLEDGSRISHYLKLKGISLPDDMVRVIIVTWHRKLNGKPLMLDEEIALIKTRMDAEKAKRDANKEVIVLEKRPHKE